MANELADKAAAAEMESVGGGAPAAVNNEDDVVSIDLPAPQGWTKKFFPKKGGTPRRNEILFIAPTGEEIKNKRQLDQYLKSHPDGPSASEFDWTTGDTPRRSARLSSKTKATDTPESGSSRKRQKKSASKKDKEKKDETDGEEESADDEAAANKSQDGKDVEMKDAEEGVDHSEEKEPKEAVIDADSAQVSDMNKEEKDEGKQQSQEEASKVASSDGTEMPEENKVEQGEKQASGISFSDGKEVQVDKNKEEGGEKQAEAQVSEKIVSDKVEAKPMENKVDTLEQQVEPQVSEIPLETNNAGTKPQEQPRENKPEAVSTFFDVELPKETKNAGTKPQEQPEENKPEAVSTFFDVELPKETNNAAEQPGETIEQPGNNLAGSVVQTEMTGSSINQTEMPEGVIKLSDAELPKETNHATEQPWENKEEPENNIAGFVFPTEITGPSINTSMDEFMSEAAPLYAVDENAGFNQGREDPGNMVDFKEVGANTSNVEANHEAAKHSEAHPVSHDGAHEPGAWPPVSC